MIQKSVTKFSLINTVEGWSYLVLVFIAMPMKYMFEMPMAVKIAGMTHGVLFIIFCLLLVQAWKDTKWPIKESVVFFIASLIPFGTFFTKKKINSYA